MTQEEIIGRLEGKFYHKKVEGISYEQYKYYDCNQLEYDVLMDVHLYLDSQIKRYTDLAIEVEKKLASLEGGLPK